MTGDDDEFEAVGVYGDDPLHIMNTDPGDGSNYYRYPPPDPCTCPPVRKRWWLMVKHTDTMPRDHECTSPAAARPGIDWQEVFDGLKIWKRR